MFLQKYQVKPIPLEEAVKLIQIAERARQGRLRAMFMKQIYLQEYRAKQARLLGDKVADVSRCTENPEGATVGHKVDMQTGVGGAPELNIPKPHL